MLLRLALCAVFVVATLAQSDYAAEWAERAARHCEKVRTKSSVVGACVSIEEAVEHAVDQQVS